MKYREPTIWEIMWALAFGLFSARAWERGYDYWVIGCWGFLFYLTMILITNIAYNKKQ